MLMVFLCIGACVFCILVLVVGGKGHESELPSCGSHGAYCLALYVA